MMNRAYRTGYLTIKVVGLNEEEYTLRLNYIKEDFDLDAVAKIANAFNDIFDDTEIKSVTFNSAEDLLPEVSAEA